jgi:AP-4 complex subunit epsilon-1
MDVPFISSGAINRTQYSLVRKVESAESTQLADQYLVSEVHAIRERFGRPSLSLVRRVIFNVILSII